MVQTPITLPELAQRLHGPSNIIGEWVLKYLGNIRKEPLEVGVTDQYALMLKDENIKSSIDMVRHYPCLHLGLYITSYGTCLRFIEILANFRRIGLGRISV